jgi:hypothetical protein
LFDLSVVLQRFSFSDLFTRPAEFCRKIFKLWQAVAHRQNGQA